MAGFQISDKELPPTTAEWMDMASAHLTWLRVAWVFANKEPQNPDFEMPDEAREELDEGLSHAADFHERLMLLANTARDRLSNL